MSYAEKVLQPGEQITYRGRLHWVVYLSGLLVVLLAAAIAVGAVLVLKDPTARVGFILAVKVLAPMVHVPPVPVMPRMLWLALRPTLAAMLMRTPDETHPAPLKVVAVWRVSVPVPLLVVADKTTGDATSLRKVRRVLQVIGLSCVIVRAAVVA